MSLDIIKKAMIQYVDENTIIFINKKTLELTNEGEKHNLVHPWDLRLIIDFVMERFDNDILEKALAYCVAIIVLHPFQNGNHRTSLESANHFLLMNDYDSKADYLEKIELEKWRMSYEENHELEREFFSITCIENEESKKDKIEEVIKSEYGQIIRKWFEKNYCKT
jgi:death-on-curing family protein